MRTAGILAVVLLASVLLAAAPRDAAQQAPRPGPAAKTGTVDFEKDVQPIFRDACYECHGPQKQKGHLRLDSKQITLSGGTSGPAIVPGDSAKSLLVERVLGHGGEERMPLQRDPLEPQQIALIRAWIDQGAVWPDRASAQGVTLKKHWSFVKPTRPQPPAVKDKGWVRNPIDHFVLARLEKEGVKPSPEADRITLARRLHLDLIGLPPTPAEVDAFVNDKSPDAYEQLVDRLLASPHYGERWGRLWLDIARYADTNGYEKDRNRTIWPYRDWVINALNKDMPFDRFTVEQIAGDMLPNATPEQVIATGFHRNTMTNEEGGIDVEEFRFKNVVDRVQTTSTAWLGLTVHCAQCHNHKYDPISHKDYYRLFAMLNNADEPGEYKIPVPEITAKRKQIQEQIARLESTLESSFPAGDTAAAAALEWTVLEPGEMKSANGATLAKQPDGSVLVSGPVPGTDVYTVTAKTDLKNVTAFRLEALTDPSLTKSGPGRSGADNGNFVLTELKATAAPAAGGGEAKPVAMHSAQADVAQPNFAAAAAFDGNPGTGWAVDDGSGRVNKDHALTVHTREPLGADGGTVLTFTIEQSYPQHTLGRFRIAAGRAAANDETPKVAPADRAAAKLAEWEKAAAPKAGRWTALRPTAVASKNHATMTVLDDASVLVGGDWPNNDTYDVDLETDLKGISAVRLEVLPHGSLPDGGPGRAPLFSVGDFLLSEIALAAGPAKQGGGKPDALQPVKLTGGTHSAASAGRSAQAALDDKVDTGWSVGPSTARPARAVFTTASPIAHDGGTRLRLTLVQQYIHQMCIGRFRVWVTTDPTPAAASDLPPEVERVLVTPADRRTANDRKTLKAHYLSIAPELAPVHQQIAALRQSMPKYPTTLAMQERRPEHARTTRIHHRGEFLQPRDPVTPGVPKVLPPLAAGTPANRMGLAKWLVDENNPLTARVTMNRFWAAFFGRGLVATVEDFGTMGERPTHPELLDWLATEFVRQRWSQKAMHRLIVTSAAYRQASHATPELLKRDPNNLLLARGPRFRVEAEMVRDIALTAAGLLDRRIGGPSVYPPQPEGVAELSWGGGAWPTSTGGDRFRRGMYTFLKRTSPYPGMTVFDGTTADVTCVRRVRSNTPLQALTLMNDQVFVEAAQAIARRVMTEGPADTLGRARFVFRLCAAREPDGQELDRILAFHDKQLGRFRGGEANAAEVAVSAAIQPPAGADLNELAAWTTVSRALLNLDETITKE